MDETNDPVTWFLLRLDGKIDRMLDDIRELKLRMTAVEAAFVGVNRRIDRLEERLDQKEHHLDFAEPG
jgi:hypothetical protein